MAYQYQSISYDSEDEVSDFINGGAYPTRPGDGSESHPHEGCQSLTDIVASYRRPKSVSCRQLISLRCILATLFLFLFVLFCFMALYFFLYDPLTVPVKIYDYIVIGSGPAGSIVARRLSDAGKQVLLLEAGGPSQAVLGGGDSFDGKLTRFDIPAFWSSLAEFPEYHWGGFNIPGVIAGKVLGGSGVENAMLYVRCTEMDMQRWNMSREWSWGQMLDTYLAIEDYCAPTKDTYDNSASPSYHTELSHARSDSPRMVTAQPAEVDPVARAFVAAATSFGIPKTKDFNAPEGRFGVGYYNFNIRGGVRDSVASRFLAPMLKGRQLSRTGVTSSRRESYQQPLNPADGSYANFDVAIEATVHRVLLSGRGLDAATCQRSTIASAPEVLDEDFEYEKYLRHVERSSISAWFRIFFLRKKAGRDVQLPRAYGVTYSQAGIVQTVYLSTPQVNVNGKGEIESVMGPAVVLSAGALGSPKILMASGIGSVEELQDADICVWVDSPRVGRGLTDHPTVGMVLAIRPTLSAEYPSAYDLLSKWNEYTRLAIHSNLDANTCPGKIRANANSTMTGFGMLASPGISSGAFLTSPYAQSRSQTLGLNGKTQPDIQLTVFPTVSEPHMQLIAQHSSHASSYTYSNNKNMLITVSLLDPLARRDLHLNTTDPDSAPTFSLPDGEKSYLHHLDIKRLEWGMEQVRGIINTEPLSSLITEELSPGSPVVSEVLRAWIQVNSFPNSHWVGSNRMGSSVSSIVDSTHGWKSDIEESVVDERLRVRGVSGLYVADASVIPIAPNGNVHSTVAAVAYRAADFILSDAGTISLSKK